jgi:UDP-N-acetylmuramyl pentapeptide phosphotransferase/UDP-N-acetylglucosamine-1-phosphate transferase
VILDLSFVVAIAFAVSLVVCRAMIWIGPVDEPTEARKQHGAPTPTSGGIGIGAGYGAAMVVLSLFSLEWRIVVSPQAVVMLWVAALFAYPLLFVGFIDDARRLSAKFKFVVYAVLALAAAWLMGVVSDVRIGGAELHLPFVVGLFGTALWVFTLLNVANFMDGSNGLAMGSVAVGLCALSVIALAGGSFGGAAIALCGAGALAGFLVWNFPAGRLFAGDSGALFAGSLAAFACLIVIARTGMSPFVAPILFFPLLADALLTLLYRARRGRSLLVAHAEHIYQIAIQSGWSHTRIALAYWAAMAACGVIAIAATGDETHTAPAVALAVLALLAVATDILVRRRAEAGGILKR